MIFLSPFLLSISSNTDNLSVALSYGIKKINLPKSSIILLSILTSISTFISMYIGRLIQPLFGFRLDNIFGGVLLSFIGVSFIVEYIKIFKNRSGYDISYYYQSPFEYKNILDNPTIIDSDKSNHIDIKKCIRLSFAIAINNFFTCFAASITGINIPLSVFFYFAISILMIYFGYYYNNTSLGKYLKNHAYLISGILLIVLGLYESII